MQEWEVTLVTQAQGGDSKCFEELYGLYHQKVFAVIRTTVKNSADAEDILQQTFLSAWRGLKNLSNPAAFNTWIQRIAINHCNELFRKKNLAILIDSEETLDAIADDAADELLPAVYAERDDLRIRLGKIIEGLSEVQRQTIILFYYNELKVDEIAGIMECSGNTVKTRLVLARKAIRSEVEEQERKSGQKFYGIAGIPMLPLARLLAQQMEEAALSPAASSGILGRITATITGEAVAAAQTAAGTGVAASTSGTAVKAAIPLIAKIIAGIAAVGLVAAAVWIIPNIQNNPPREAPPAVTEASGTEQDAATAPPDTTEPASELPDDSVRQVDVELTEEQLAFLKPLEEALLAYDMDAAFPLLRSEEFRAICRGLPQNRHDTYYSVYKFDEYGEWAVDYFVQVEVVGENFGIAVVDSYENGRRLFAEASLREGEITGGTMMTYDIVDGEYDDNFHDAIAVEVTESGVRIFRYEPDF